MRKKSKSRRGRRAGQAAKQHTPDLTLHQHAMLAQNGTYAPGVVDLLADLDRLARLKQHLESLPTLERWKLIHDHDQSTGLGVGMTPCTRRMLEWGPGNMNPFALFNALGRMDSKALDFALKTLLSAVARRDATFFKDMARRMASDDKLGNPAEPHFSSLIQLEIMRRYGDGKMPCETGWEDVPSFVDDIRAHIKKETGVDYSEKVIREAMKSIGRARRRRGNPQFGT